VRSATVNTYTAELQAVVSWAISSAAQDHVPAPRSHRTAGRYASRRLLEGQSKVGLCCNGISKTLTLRFFFFGGAWKKPS